MEEKVLSLGKFSDVATGARRALPPFLFNKNAVFGTLYNDKKSDNDVKRNITICNPTYLTKVTYISSISMFLNTEILVVQVSNTRFNNQSLHL